MYESTMSLKQKIHAYEAMVGERSIYLRRLHNGKLLGAGGGNQSNDDSERCGSDDEEFLEVIAALTPDTESGEEDSGETDKQRDPPDDDFDLDVSNPNPSPRTQTHPPWFKSNFKYTIGDKNGNSDVDEDHVMLEKPQRHMLKVAREIPGAYTRVRYFRIAVKDGSRTIWVLAIHTDKNKDVTPRWVPVREIYDYDTDRDSDEDEGSQDSDEDEGSQDSDEDEGSQDSEAAEDEDGQGGEATADEDGQGDEAGNDANGYTTEFPEGCILNDNGDPISGETGREGHVKLFWVGDNNEVQVGIYKALRQLGSKKQGLMQYMYIGYPVRGEQNVHDAPLTSEEDKGIRFTLP